MKRKLIPVGSNLALANDLIMFLLTKKYPDDQERFKIIGNNVELAYDCCEPLAKELNQNEFYELVDTYTYRLHYLLLKERN